MRYWNNSQGSGKVTWRRRDQKQKRDSPNQNIVDIHLFRRVLGKWEDVLPVGLQWKATSESQSEKKKTCKEYNSINWKKTMEYKSDGDTNFNWCTRYSHQTFIHALKEMEIKGRVQTIQTKAMLRSARILRKVLETWGDLLSLKLQKNAGLKN